MIFFGIISNKKDFNIIKLEIEKSIKDASIILIDKENIENLQNIKFEALIINSEINLDNKSIVFLQKICKNLKYLIVKMLDLAVRKLLKDEKNMETY